MILRGLLVAALSTAAALPQSASAPNSQPNPYRTAEHWYQLPEGRTMGSTSAVTITPDGHIWVVDDAQDKIKVFNNQGRLLIYMGDHGYYPGQFMGAWGIAIDKLNRVVVSETYPGRVQVFRYITDAEAAAEKARRESGEQKSASTSAPAQKSPAALQSQETADASAKKDSAAH